MKKMIRLALRREGDFWNAYVASDDTMKGAFLIGSIAMGSVLKNPAIKEAFMELMRQVMAAGVEEATGKPPEAWFTRPAPESERGGSA
jgi:hypothetical protein